MDILGYPKSVAMGLHSGENESLPFCRCHTARTERLYRVVRSFGVETARKEISAILRIRTLAAFANAFRVRPLNHSGRIAVRSNVKYDFLAVHAFVVELSPPKNSDFNRSASLLQRGVHVSRCMR